MKKKKTNRVCSDDKVQKLGYNIDTDKCSRCIRAGYYKMGLGNFLYHPNDGFTAPCVIEFTLEDD